MGSNVHRLPIVVMAGTWTISICYHEIHVEIVKYGSVIDVIKSLPLISYQDVKHSG